MQRSLAKAEQPFSESDPAKGFAVVELFTSQGCSSCPPADAVLKELVQEAETQHQNVFALSFHVDYWNSLGWKDPYSSKRFSERQRRYAEAFHSDNIYTPQMIVNGQAEFVGSSSTKAHQYVHEALAATPSLSLSAQQASSMPSSGNVRVQFAVSARQAHSTLICIALVRNVEPVSVTAGENSGRKLSHTHVVRAFETQSLKDLEGTLDVHLPSEAPQTLPLSAYRAIVYLQDGVTMKVIAATSVALR